MPDREVRSVSDRVLSRIDVRRRDFMKALIVGTTFATPVITSVSLGSAAPPTSPVLGPPRGHRLEIPTTADGFLQESAPNANEGAHPRLRVGINPVARSVIQFDPATLRLALRRPVFQVTLALDIANNEDNVGLVAAHALLERFTEGNAAQSGLPTSEAFTGSGAGATWNTSEDLDISNTTLETVREPWRGGRFQLTPTAEATHSNRATGTVEWDVTDDAMSGITAWLLKLPNETPPTSPPTGPPTSSIGDQVPFPQQRGTVEYFSRQAEDGTLQAARLIFSYAAS